MVKAAERRVRYRGSRSEQKYLRVDVIAFPEAIVRRIGG